MSLWQKLTIDWPCAVGDWLWAALVMTPARFLDRLTWRSAFILIFRLFMLWMLIRFAAEIASLDLTFLFTLDATIYWEAGAALMLLSARGLSRQMLGATTRFLAQTVRARLPRFARRTRPPVRHTPDSGDDEGAWAWAVFSPDAIFNAARL